MKIKKMLSSIIAAAMLLSSIELTAFAEATVYEVKNDTELAEAIREATDGDTIKIANDIELIAPVVIDSKHPITIDLNGNTMSYNSTTQGEAMITNKGDLTIKDSGECGVINYNYTGAADSTYSKGNYTISNAGALTIEGGKITIANLSGHAKYPIDNNSTTGNAILVINGGHLYNYNTSAIRQFCNSTTYKNSVTINGGLIEGYCAIWVQNPGRNTVNGELKIAGGEIKTTAKAYVEGTAAIRDVSSAIYCTLNGGAWGDDSAISITGGIINENVSFAENAPTNVTVSDKAICNGYVELSDTDDKYLPVAEVKNLGAITFTPNWVVDINKNFKDVEKVPTDLQIAMEFIAQDTPEQAASNAFADYTTDFFIEINNLSQDSFDATGCYLAGHYGDFEWVQVLLDGMTIEEGKIYPVITSVGFDFSYVDICTSVKDFKCGIYLTEEVLNSNPDLEVKLTLGLSKNKNSALNADFITIDEAIYLKNDFGKKLCNWVTNTDAGFYMDGQTKYGMIRFLFAADVYGEIEEYGIKYSNEDNITEEISTDGKTISAIGNTNAFYGDLIGISENSDTTYYASAFIKVGGKYLWSEVINCSPNWENNYTGYTGGEN